MHPAAKQTVGLKGSVLGLMFTQPVLGSEITDQDGVPLLPLPSSVKQVGPLAAAHLISSGPAAAVGLGLTRSTTSSLAGEHGGVTSLVTVSRSVAEPVHPAAKQTVGL